MTLLGLGQKNKTSIVAIALCTFAQVEAKTPIRRMNSSKSCE